MSALLILACLAVGAKALWNLSHDTRRYRAAREIDQPSRGMFWAGLIVGTLADLALIVSAMSAYILDSWWILGAGSLGAWLANWVVTVLFYRHVTASEQ